MVILKSKLSGFYFKGFGAWTENPCDAFTFLNEWAARGFVRREAVEDVQVMELELTLHLADAA